MQKKHLRKVQQPFMIKILNLGIEKNLPQPDKEHLQKPYI